MSSSGKIALTVPSALLWLFAYTHHAWNRHHFQAFPSISPVSGAVPQQGKSDWSIDIPIIRFIWERLQR
jgi:hypothetical protein